MREQLTSRLQGLQRTFAAFTPGQKTVAIIGGLALLLASFLVFRWAATPAYAPLFTNMAPADASAVIDELDKNGTPYQLTDGGNTILVPREQVYDARIQLSGQGLPSEGTDGYALLDDQSLSTSQFQEQTSYKRAIEGELEKTIEALDVVDTAVVHVAMPQEELFESDTKPTTASVLVDTRAGQSMEAGQVQAVVNLVASSVEGLDPKQVTVTDSTGQVLSAAGDSAATVGDARAQQVQEFEERMRSSVSAMLDRVLGGGNSAVAVTADLNFDQTTTQTTRFFTDPEAIPLTSSTMTETYTAPGNGNGLRPGGVVGPDGQLDPAAEAPPGATEYSKEQQVSDNAVNKEIEQREAAPGNVESLHFAVVLDQRALGAIDVAAVEDLVSSSVGIDADRGDTVEVTAMPFDRSQEKENAAALAAAKKAEERAELISLAKTVGLILVVLAVLVLAWRRSKKNQQAREQATTYVVEQLRRTQEPAPAVEPPTQTPAEILAAGNSELRVAARDEIAELVERQPQEVAQLLRGWLTEGEPMTLTMPSVGVRKVAVLLVQLGQEKAATLLSYLSDSEVEAISAEIAQLDSLGADETEEVLTEFRHLATAQMDVLRGGPEFARALLEQSLGAERAESIMNQLAASAMKLPFQFLHRADPRQLVSFIAGEHPQVIAVVLAHLSSDKATMVLSALEPELQADVAHRIAVMDRSNPELLSALEQRLERKMSSVLQPAELASIGGVDPLIQIINRSDRATERLIVEGLQQRDPELAEEIKSRMFMFDDITLLEDRDMQLVLRQVDNGDLAMALKGVTEEVKAKVTTNMSERAATTLLEDIDLLGPVLLRQVEEAQQKIILTIRRLEDAGEIQLRRGADEEYVV